MPDRLFIGTRRYSSWSLRGWLAVRLAGISATDVVVQLAGGQTPTLQGLTPSGLVPALEIGGRMIWDSLAICEYCAELHPALWPADRIIRAVARSVAAEMHAGFSALRQAMPMNLGRSAPLATIPEPVATDIARITTVWQTCLRDSGGPFLFGTIPTVPDVMYAPVVARFISYVPALSPQSAAYCAAVRALPAVQNWYDLAMEEPLSWRLAKYE